MKKIDNIECYRVFCAVAVCGSVREAAVKLCQEPSNLFRVIRQLEDELDSVLFERQSRPMKLTAQGEVFYEHAQRLIREQASLVEALHEGLDSDSGLIQIASTAGVRHQLLAPSLVQYKEENPGISIELRDMVQGSKNLFVATDGTPNDVVLTFRTDQPVPAGSHVKELLEVPFIACASPVYLERMGEPASPVECAGHQGVILKLPGRSSVTHLVAKDGRFEQLLWKTTSTYNSQLDAIEALVLGVGICPDIGLSYFVEQQRKGLLVEVLQGWSCPPRMACLYISEQAWKKRRVRLFAAWIADRYKAHITECLKAWRTSCARGAGA